MTAEELVTASPYWDGSDYYYDWLLKLAEEYIGIEDNHSLNGFNRYIENNGKDFLDDWAMGRGYKETNFHNTNKERITFLEELLAFKGERYNSDQHIHLGLCIEHICYAEELQEQKSLHEAMEHIDKALEHIRLSYTASQESGAKCELERNLPDEVVDTLLECWLHPSYPYFVEAGIWLEKACLCMNMKEWEAACGYIIHAENFCKITQREFYKDVLALCVDPHFADQIDCEDEKIVYNYIIEEKEEILKHINPSEFNKNTPSDDFLEKYTWSFDPEDDAKPIVAHWQNMIMRRDFHIFSEQQCYLILLHFYFFYWHQLNCEQRDTLLNIITDCIDKAICASPINTGKTDYTLLDPWVIHTDDGRIINAYKKPESIEHMEVFYWAWKADFLSNYNRERESMFARMHAEFLDRIYFFDTKDYALNSEYFTPAYLVKVYKDNINKDCTLDLMEYAEELLDINPAAKLHDFVDFLQQRVDWGEEPR